MLEKYLYLYQEYEETIFGSQFFRYGSDHYRIGSVFYAFGLQSETDGIGFLSFRFLTFLSSRFLTVCIRNRTKPNHAQPYGLLIISQKTSLSPPPLPAPP